jgi:hypothetical protein
LVLADGIVGMTEASATNTCLIPWTAPRASTTAAHRTTTAESVLTLFARGVSAASPASRKTSVQVGTGQAERASVLHLEKVIGSAAVRARDIPDRRDDKEVGARLRSARRLVHASSPADAIIESFRQKAG